MAVGTRWRTSAYNQRNAWVTADDLCADGFAEKTMDDFEAEMVAEADEVEYHDDGGFTARYHLDREDGDGEEPEPDGEPHIQ